MRIDTPQEWLYYRHGGILQFVLRQLLARFAATPDIALRKRWTPNEPDSSCRQRERIERELTELRSDRGDGELSNVDQHTADSGSELFEIERDRSLITRLQHDLEAIERAERRLEEGTYGAPVDSGEPIPDGRLEAVPWAERTAEEQSRLESR